MIYTTYFAKLKSLPKNIVPVSICAKVPDWYTGLQYKKLAPKYDSFVEWKKNHDNDYYIERFQKEVLDLLDPSDVIREIEDKIRDGKIILSPVNFALVCYEKSSDFCHRHLVAEWLKKNGIACEEWDAIELSVLNEERLKLIEKHSSLEQAICNINKDITSLQIESIKEYIGKKFKDKHANYYLPIESGTELVGKTAIQCFTFNPTVVIYKNKFLQPCQIMNIFLIDENGNLYDEYEEVTDEEFNLAYDKFTENLKIILNNVDKKT